MDDVKKYGASQLAFSEESIHKIKRTPVPVDLIDVLHGMRNDVENRRNQIALADGLYKDVIDRPAMYKWREWMFVYGIIESVDKPGLYCRVFTAGIPGTPVHEIPEDQVDMIVCALHKTIFDSFGFQDIPDTIPISEDSMMLSQMFLPMFLTRPKMVRL